MKYGNKHDVYIGNFFDHVVKQELASAQGYKIILLFDVVYNYSLYRVESPNGEAKGFDTLPEAIEYYNSL